MANISDPKVREKVFNKYSGKCAYCGDPLKKRFTIDHIIPKRRGDPKHKNKGTDELTNYNPCCFSCNSSKGTFSLDEWRDRIKYKLDMINRNSAQYRILKRFGIVKEVNKEIKYYFEVYNG